MRFPIRLGLLILAIGLLTGCLAKKRGAKGAGELRPAAGPEVGALSPEVERQLEGAFEGYLTEAADRELSTLSLLDPVSIDGPTTPIENYKILPLRSNNFPDLVYVEIFPQAMGYFEYKICDTKHPTDCRNGKSYSHNNVFANLPSEEVSVQIRPYYYGTMTKSKQGEYGPWTPPKVLTLRYKSDDPLRSKLLVDQALQDNLNQTREAFRANFQTLQNKAKTCPAVTQKPFGKVLLASEGKIAGDQFFDELLHDAAALRQQDQGSLGLTDNEKATALASVFAVCQHPMALGAIASLVAGGIGYFCGMRAQAAVPVNTQHAATLGELSAVREEKSQLEARITGLETELGKLKDTDTLLASEQEQTKKLTAEKAELATKVAELQAKLVQMEKDNESAKKTAFAEGRSQEAILHAQDPEHALIQDWRLGDRSLEAVASSGGVVSSARPGPSGELELDRIKIKEGKLDYLTLDFGNHGRIVLNIKQVDGRFCFELLDGQLSFRLFDSAGFTRVVHLTPAQTNRLLVNRKSQSELVYSFASYMRMFMVDLPRTTSALISSATRMELAKDYLTNSIYYWHADEAEEFLAALAESGKFTRQDIESLVTQYRAASGAENAIASFLDRKTFLPLLRGPISKPTGDAQTKIRAMDPFYGDGFRGFQTKQGEMLVPHASAQTLSEDRIRGIFAKLPTHRGLRLSGSGTRGDQHPTSGVLHGHGVPSNTSAPATPATPATPAPAPSARKTPHPLRLAGVAAGVSLSLFGIYYIVTGGLGGGGSPAGGLFPTGGFLLQGGTCEDEFNSAFLETYAAAMGGITQVIDGRLGPVGD